MIYLITGNMGTGKTSLVVDWILNNYNGLFKTTADDGTEIPRPLYFCHIDGLKKDLFKAHELTEQQLQSDPLDKVVPIGSVVIVDECDYCYPLMPAGREVPPYIKTLKELRHHGLTLILMTQHPSLLNSYVRRLVSMHVHLERKIAGTKKYTFYRAEENLTTSTFSATPSEFYKPPEKAFDYYESSSKHVKFKKKLPWQFWLIPICFSILLWRGFVFYDKYTKDDESIKDTETVQMAASMPQIASMPSMSIDGVQAPIQAASTPVLPVGTKVTDYQPRIDSLPETKPIYDSMRNVVNMETVIGCVESKTDCNCYTQQATTVYVNEQLCKKYARGGVFQLYRPMGDTQTITPGPGA